MNKCKATKVRKGDLMCFSYWGRVKDSRARELPTGHTVDVANVDDGHYWANLKDIAMLPTPQARDYRSTKGEACMNRDNPSQNLNVVVEKMLPTPQTSDANMRQGIDTPSHQRNLKRRQLASVALESTKETFPTPTRSDAKGSGPIGSSSQEAMSEKGHLCATVKNWPTPKASDGIMGMTANCSDRPPEKSTHLQAQVAIAEEWERGSGQLNPTWVELLMGFPIGWTIVYERFRDFGIIVPNAWLPGWEDDILRVVNGVSSKSNINKCAKRTVMTVIIGNGEWRGFNNCATPQETCPRAPDEGYDKCKTICNQPNHAEINALMLAGDGAKDSEMFIYGHDHCCDPCLDAAKSVGVNAIHFMKGSDSRVDRLRALGNAVVPQCAYFVGQCILAWICEKDESD